MSEITIAVCVYNGEKYIKETLSRIIAQSFQSFDLLIVNDCSTDATLQIINDFFTENLREYRLINLEKNKGIANARQTALERAETRYLLFVDADDLPHSELLKKESRLISLNEDAIAVSCWSEYIDENGKRMQGGLFIGDKTKEDFISRASRDKLIFLPIQTLFDRVAALRVGGFRLDGFPKGVPRYQDFCEDLDLWTRMSDLYTEGKYMIVIPEILYSYRKGSTGLSSNTFFMNLKMKYIKTNLLLRRAGKTEVSFYNFHAALSGNELNTLQQAAVAADCLREGIISLKKKKIGHGILNILKSMWLRPEYVWQKIKSNSGLFK
ncbi:MAG: glycosyltransferase family 2 protein [Tannerella sp.]|jgi:glycosyltransferase involved in cell wall biosynthesis|nr:glycosyltransferase family 2 protein [Tannerella sp.]